MLLKRKEREKKRVTEEKKERKKAKRIESLLEVGFEYICEKNGLSTLENLNTKDRQNVEKLYQKV